MIKKPLILITTFVLAVLLVEPVAAQGPPETPIPPDFVQLDAMEHIDFGQGSPISGPAGPYTGTILSDPTTPQITLYCIDWHHSVRSSSVWWTNVTSLTSNDFSNTRLGVTNNAPLPTPTVWTPILGQLTTQQRYATAAYLSSLFGSSASDRTRWNGIHTAIWTLMSHTGDWQGTSSIAAATDWLEYARDNFVNNGGTGTFQAAGFNASNWSVLTDKEVTTCNNATYSSCGIQEYLVSTVPEPETWFMLITGLGIVGIVARRKQLSES